MHYVVVDFEWNQPMSWQSSTFKEVGDQLIFEMIQVGAVKLNEDLEIVDTLSVPISPTVYVRIHPRIRRMTGLGQEELAGAPVFNEAMAQFADWCGDDYVLLTWGCDDVSVLQQNLDFFHCETALAPMYDIQHLFSDIHKCKDRKGLKTAMEMLEIEPDEDRPFHNALHDAWYTAKVFQTLPDPKAVLKYGQTPKKLTHSAHHTKEKGPAEAFATVAEALASPTALEPVCPRCGRSAVLDGGYVKQCPGKYLGIAKCDHHGRLLIRLHFKPSDDGTKLMYRSCSAATPSNVAYVHTKALQMAEKNARYMEEHGCLPDPDEEVMNAERNDMPFDD